MIALTTRTRAGSTAPCFPMEHRWGERVRCGTPVWVTPRGEPGCFARLRDVSMSGAFIETERTPRLFQQVAVRVDAADAGAGDGINLEATVVRIARDGIGVEWNHAPGRSFCALLGCARRCTETPAARPDRECNP